MICILISQEISDLAEQLLSEGRSGDVSDPIVISLHWHTIIGRSEGNVTQEQIQASMDVLNRDYNGTGFQFELKSVDYTFNPFWFVITPDHEGRNKDMKGTLRKGGRADLNIYTAGITNQVLGYATLPQDYEGGPEMDGVVIHFDSLPGGSFEHFNLGRTLTHEVGHWLVSRFPLELLKLTFHKGLHHPFYGGCSFPNDFVADTRPQRRPSDGCPHGARTCQVNNFYDPEHVTLFEQVSDLYDAYTNFMDYSYDSCMQEFTQGQISRIKAQFLSRLEGSFTSF